MATPADTGPPPPSPSPSPVSIPAPSSLPVIPSLSALSGSLTSILPSASPFPTSLSLNSTTSSSTSSTSSSNASTPHTFLTPTLTHTLVPIVAIVGLALVLVSVWLVQGCCTRKAKVRYKRGAYSRNEGDGGEDGGLVAVRYEDMEVGEGSRGGGGGYGREPKNGFDAEDQYDRYHYNPGEAYQLNTNAFTRERGYDHTAWVDSSAYETPERSSSTAYTGLAAQAGYNRSRSSGGYREVQGMVIEEEDEYPEKALSSGREAEDEYLPHPRTILERVRADEGWRDEVRLLPGSTPRRGGGSGGTVSPLRFPTRSRTPRREEAWIEDGRKRRSIRSPMSVGMSKSGSGSRYSTEPLRTPWSEEGSRGGFRIVEESPALIHEQGRGGSVSGGGHTREPSTRRDYFSFAKYKLPPLGGDSVPVDRIDGKRAKATTQPPTRISILPLSPPRIMSPPLESALLFTPSPGLSTTFQGLDAGATSLGGAMSESLNMNADTRARSREGGTRFLEKLAERGVHVSGKGKPRDRDRVKSGIGKAKERTRAERQASSDGPGVLPYPNSGEKDGVAVVEPLRTPARERRMVERMGRGR